MKRVNQIVVSAISSLLLFAVGIVSAQSVDEIVYFHPNALGSATAAYSEAGQECWSQDYTPYGEKIDPMDGFPPGGCGLLGGERGYTGHVQDTTGLVYMQQRYYDPTLMRFLSIDPVGVTAAESKTFNRYVYAVNNPYKYIDPNGEYIESPIEAASIALGGANLARNIEDGNIGGALVDALGIIGDFLGAAVPGIPGVFGLGITTMRSTPKSSVVGDLADDGVDLFRVVDDAELENIRKTGEFKTVPGAFEGKQFVDNIDDAKALQKKFSKFFGGNQTIVRGIAPKSVVDNASKIPFSDIPNGMAITVPKTDLPAIRPKY